MATSALKPQPAAVAALRWDERTPISVASCPAASAGVRRPARTSFSPAPARGLHLGIGPQRPLAVALAATCASSRPPELRAEPQIRRLACMRRRCSTIWAHSSSSPRFSCAEVMSTGGVQFGDVGVKMASAPLIDRCRLHRPGAVVAIGLGDGDHVGDLDDAALDTLKLVAAAGEQKDKKEIDHAGDGDLRLADANRLHQHDIEASRLDERHRLARLARHPPSVPEVGEGRMKADWLCARRAMRVLSARIEPPERVDVGSTASTATRWPCSMRLMPS